MQRRRGIKRGNDERRSRTGDGSHCQPFPSSTSCLALQIYTNLTGLDRPKTPFQCQILLLRSLVTIPPSLIPLPSFVFIFIFLPVYHTLLSASHHPPHPSAHMEIFPPLSLSTPLSWVLEDPFKPRGRKSTFLPHQLAKPNVEKAQLKAIPLLMLTAVGYTPFA